MENVLGLIKEVCRINVPCLLIGTREYAKHATCNLYHTILANSWTILKLYNNFSERTHWKPLQLNWKGYVLVRFKARNQDMEINGSVSSFFFEKECGNLLQCPIWKPFPQKLVLVFMQLSPLDLIHYHIKFYFKNEDIGSKLLRIFDTSMFSWS